MIGSGPLQSQQEGPQIRHLVQNIHQKVPLRFGFPVAIHYVDQYDLNNIQTRIAYTWDIFYTIKQEHRRRKIMNLQDSSALVLLENITYALLVHEMDLMCSYALLL